MRKIFLFAFIIVFIGYFKFGFCQNAPPIKNRWNIGTDFVYIFPEDAEYKETTRFLGRGSVGYGISNNFAVELEAQAFKLRSKNETSTRVYSLMTNMELRAKNFGKFVPYALGGVGWAFFNYDDLHPTEQKDKTNSYAWKAGAGIEYFLNNNWAFNLETVHFYANTGGKTHLDVYSQQYSIGVKYYF